MNTVGNDLRKAVFDGYAVENCVASDLHPGMPAAMAHLIHLCFG